MSSMIRLFAALLFIGAAPFAQALEMFSQVKSPGGIAFWHLQRADAKRSIILASFEDVFALRHADKIAAPLMGASLLQSGPKGMSLGEFNEQLKDFQARCGVSAGVLNSTFTIETKPEDLGEAVDLCFKLLTEPALRESDMERMRKAIVANHERLETNRNALAGYVLRRLTTFNSPFGRWSEPEELTKITTGDVDLWRREVFARDNLTLIAVGTQDAAAFGAMIDKSFATLPEKAAAKGGVSPAPVYSGKTILYEKEGEQTTIVMEADFAIDNTEGPAITIGNNVLGGGMEKRLGRAVRGEQGATYGISSGIGQLAPGQRTFSIRSSLANDLAAAGLKRAREEYERWRAGDVTDAENEASRTLLATNLEKSVESPGGKASALLNMLRTGRTAEDEARYTERMLATPAADINRVLREKMPKRLTTLIIAPKAEGFEADCVIRALGEIDKCR